MSRGAPTRAALDAYWTPDAVARRCVRWLAGHMTAPTVVLEPSVGGGAWVRAARAEWPHAPIGRVDLDPSAPGLTTEWREGDTRWPGLSWLDLAAPSRDAQGLVLGNPPYDQVDAHITASLRTGDRVALLLRETATGGAERHRRLWAKHPPAWIGKLPDRPKWEGACSHKHGDTAGSVLVLWDAEQVGTRWDWIAREAA